MGRGGHGDVAKADLLTGEEREQSVVIADPARPDCPIIFVSDEFERQTGYPPHEVLGRNCRFLQGPGTDPGAVRAIRDALAARTGITVDVLNYRKDGTPFLNRLRIRPLLDERGRLLYYAGAQNPVAPGDAILRPVGLPLG